MLGEIRFRMDEKIKKILKRIVKEADKLDEKGVLSEYGAGQRDIAILLLGETSVQSRKRQRD